MELIMSEKSPNSFEEEYFYLNIESYLGLSLAKEESKKFKKIVEEHKWEDRVNAYKHAKFQYITDAFPYVLF